MWVTLHGVKHKWQEVSYKADKEIDTGRLTQGSLKKTKTKMAAKQSMTQVIMLTVIEVTKAAIMAKIKQITSSTMQINTHNATIMQPITKTTHTWLESGKQISGTVHTLK